MAEGNRYASAGTPGKANAFAAILWLGFPDWRDVSMMIMRHCPKWWSDRATELVSGFECQNRKSSSRRVIFAMMFGRDDHILGTVVPKKWSLQLLLVQLVSSNG